MVPIVALVGVNSVIMGVVRLCTGKGFDAVTVWGVAKLLLLTSAGSSVSGTAWRIWKTFSLT